MTWAPADVRAVRGFVFATFAAEGRPPSVAECARRLGLTERAVRLAWRELHDRHALVLGPELDWIRMAHPFSAVPMGFVVRRGEARWWGGCAWDAFGIAAALDAAVEITTSCPACGESLAYFAGPKRAPTGRGVADVVVRVPRPAREWWEDVVATCSGIRAFCHPDHLEGWLARAARPRGEAVPLEQLWALAGPWYRDRLRDDWEPRPRPAAQALLDEAGLHGDFWALP